MVVTCSRSWRLDGPDCGSVRLWPCGCDGEWDLERNRDNLQTQTCLQIGVLWRSCVQDAWGGRVAARRHSPPATTSTSTTSAAVAAVAATTTGAYLLVRTLLPTSPTRLRTCADRLTLRQALKRSIPSTPVSLVYAPQQRRWKTERPAPPPDWACEYHQCSPARDSATRGDIRRTKSFATRVYKKGSGTAPAAEESNLNGKPFKEIRPTVPSAGHREASGRRGHEEDTAPMDLCCAFCEQPLRALTAPAKTFSCCSKAQPLPPN
jgi:hypothetical protein